MNRELKRKLNTQHSNFRNPSGAKKDIDLKYLHELFIKYKLYGARHSQATIKSHRQCFGLFLKFNCEMKLEDLTEKTIINFFEFIDTRERKVGRQQIFRTYKNSSVTVLRNILNIFFNWLIERQYIEVNPFDKIPYPKVSYTDKRAFTVKEFETICYAVNTKIHWTNLLIKKRNVAIIMLLSLTGVRREELLGLQLSDIDMYSKLILVRAETSKSKQTRIIPMNLQLVPYLEDYLLYREKFSTLFLWVSGIQDRGFTEHGAKHFIRFLSNVTKINCHLHRFRHTFATNYYKQTHDIVGLQKLLGHRGLKMTLRYLRSLPDEHIVEQMHKLTIGEFV